jgi:hypothetical protein
MLYLYGITEGFEPPAVPGLRDAPLFAIRERGLAAIVSEHDELELEADEDELWAHEAVVEALMQEGAVLPMRIGSVVADAQAVRGLLRERAAGFWRTLESVRGAVELGVRAAATRPLASQAPAPVAPVPRGPGTTYMLARLSDKAREDEAAGRIHEALRPLARRHTAPTSSVRRGAMRSAYLVDQDRVDAFAARVEELQHALDGVSIACTGPWPPYSFTQEQA